MATESPRALPGHAQAGASPIGGRLLTIGDLLREQASLGIVTVKEVTLARRTDPASASTGHDALVDAVSVLPWVAEDPLV